MFGFFFFKFFFFFVEGFFFFDEVFLLLLRFFFFVEVFFFGVWTLFLCVLRFFLCVSLCLTIHIETALHLLLSVDSACRRFTTCTMVIHVRTAHRKHKLSRSAVEFCSSGSWCGVGGCCPLSIATVSCESGTSAELDKTSMRLVAG